MRILVSNDDGYFSPGIEALARAVSSFGEVVVYAPERDRSGASNSLTLDRPLRIRKAHNGFHYVDGTPTDCVHIAVTGILDSPPDLIVSGINDGANMGDDTIYSGTVAAAMEGHLLGLPCVAFSLAGRGFEHLDAAEHVVRELVGRLVRSPLKRSLLLNVNIPSVPLDCMGPMVVTRLGRRHNAEPVIPALNPRGQTVYWIGAAGPERDAGEGTDFHAVRERRVSITPLHADLTATGHLDHVRQWLVD